jgi:hypothetical protein
MEDPPVPSVDAQAPRDGLADAVANERATALAAIAAIRDQVAAAATATENGQNGADTGNAAPEEVSRPRKKRFGPPANAPREAPKPRKRKSRWETDTTSDSKALIVNNGPLWPTDVTLPGGITVLFATAVPCFVLVCVHQAATHCQIVVQALVRMIRRIEKVFVALILAECDRAVDMGRPPQRCILRGPSAMQLVTCWEGKAPPHTAQLKQGTE